MWNQKDRMGLTWQHDTHHAMYSCPSMRQELYSLVSLFNKNLLFLCYALLLIELSPWLELGGYSQCTSRILSSIIEVVQNAASLSMIDYFKEWPI